MAPRLKHILAALVLTGGLATAVPAAALTPDEAAALPERSIGKPDAPLTIIEYASLTCHHCADFQEKILPQLKTKYIETGKVKLVFRDYAFDGVGLRVAAVARCMPESSYHPYITMLFKNQSSWLAAEDPVKAAIQYAKLGGLNAAEAQACADSEKLTSAISEAQLAAEKNYEVQATPTFVLGNAQEIIRGAESFENFSAKIDALLAKGGAPKTEAAPQTDAPKP